MRKVAVLSPDGTKQDFIGWFHGFFQCGDNENGTESIAVTEDIETGACFEIQTYRVVFVDKPKRKDFDDK